MVKREKAPLTDKQKEDLAMIIPIQKYERLINNLNLLFEEDDTLKDWEISSYGHKGMTVSLSLKLKPNVIPREIEELSGQKKIDDFKDPDKEKEELEFEIN